MGTSSNTGLHTDGQQLDPWAVLRALGWPC